ncbi:hypothetical protein [Streptomyces sp. NPDC048590]|uniref:hypothetical protein n=1 Tax=Streptomyces sp. NPDC048590 TaxID=3365574 RepID=UPI00371205BF
MASALGRSADGGREGDAAGGGDRNGDCGHETTAAPHNGVLSFTARPQDGRAVGERGQARDTG